MFTSQSLRAVVKPGAVAFREQRLDDVVHQVDVRGTLNAQTTPELERRIGAALAGGVRWLIVDLSEAPDVDAGAFDALVDAGRELRSRRGELIVVGKDISHLDVAHRPAVATNVDQAVMILKMLRPKTEIHRSPAKRITSLTLPRIEPTG